MNKENLIQLTQNLYRLTMLFPKKEPLRYRMRGLADDILAYFFVDSVNNFSGKTEIEPLSFPKKIGAGLLTFNTENKSLRSLLEVMDGFFEVAKSQNWVNSSDVLMIQDEYDSLKEELKFRNIKNTSFNNQSIVEKKLINPMRGRQEEILEFLRKQGKVQVSHVQHIFPKLTKRTLRRDFEQMLNQGIIERIGENNNTFYQLC